MNFKNNLEKDVFEAAKDICGSLASIEHNKEIEIERADGKEVAAFSGPPKKEIDVITAGYAPNIRVLISCKNFSGSRVEPKDVQEWATVTKTMNEYSIGSVFLGIVISPTGFTSGCEGWATTANLALIPPLKGKQTDFEYGSTIQMTRRVLGAVGKRLCFPHEELLRPPGFYDFVFNLTKDFEGRDIQKNVQRGRLRYTQLGTGWVSSFGELVNTLIGKRITETIATNKCLGLRLSDGLSFRIIGNQIQFGADNNRSLGMRKNPLCRKNLSSDQCTFKFVKNLVIEQRLISAADFGSYFEFGLSNEVNLSFYPGVLHVVRTRNPLEKNLL